MGRVELFEIADDGFHLEWECVILRYEGCQILAKKVKDIGMDNLLGEEVYDLPVPKKFPEQLPFEPCTIGEKPVVTMPNGSLKRLCARKWICSSREWTNSTATAVAFGTDIDEKLYGRVIAEFEQQSEE